MRTGVKTVQLQGDVSPQDISLLKKEFPETRIIKAIHVTGEESTKKALEYLHHVDAFLLDTRTEDRPGGTGLIHDWSISERIVSAVTKPVILAGGLNPENVEEAIEKVKPFAVDVNSGTKGPDGFKFPEKVRALITNARRAFAKLVSQGINMLKFRVTFKELQK